MPYRKINRNNFGFEQQGPSQVVSLKILHYSIVLYLDLAHIMTPNNRKGEILTIREVAEYLKITERTVYRLAAAKQIPAFKVGGAWRFRIVDIDSWIAAQLKTAGGTD